MNFSCLRTLEQLRGHHHGFIGRAAEAGRPVLRRLADSSPDAARAEDGATDAGLGQLGAQVEQHGDDAGLRGRVGCVLRKDRGKEAGHRRGRHDVTVPCRDHVREKSAEAVRHTDEVDLQDPVHVGIGHVRETFERRGAGIREEQRHPPELLVRGSLQLDDRRALADVAADTERGATLAPDLVRDRVGPVGQEIADDDRGPSRGERSRHAATDTAAASRDHRDPARHVGHGDGARAAAGTSRS